MSDWESNEPNEPPEERDAAVEYERGYRAGEAAAAERQERSDQYMAGRADGLRAALKQMPQMLRDLLPEQPEILHLMSLAASADLDDDAVTANLVTLSRLYPTFESALIGAVMFLVMETAPPKLAAA